MPKTEEETRFELARLNSKFYRDVSVHRFIEIASMATQELQDNLDQASPEEKAAITLKVAQEMRAIYAVLLDQVSGHPDYTHKTKIQISDTEVLVILSDYEETIEPFSPDHVEDVFTFADMQKVNEDFKETKEALDRLNRARNAQ